MDELDPALRVALAAAEQLPGSLRLELAERVIATTPSDQTSILIHLQRLSPEKQRRLDELLECNTEGRISRAERAELTRLVNQVDRMTLANSEALARAMRPELFDEDGRVDERRIRRALRSPSGMRNRRRNRTAQHE